MNFSLYEIFTFKRPSPLSKIKEEVPKPDGSWAVGLPLWNHVDLDTKLPMIPAPPGKILFSRGKLGEPTSKTSDAADFILHDPYCREVSYEYDACHDKHLRQWFKNDENRKSLLKFGIINENRDVLCNLKQYNEYRRYLNRLHSDAVGKERERRESLAQEKCQIEKAQFNVKKEMLKLLKKEKFDMHKAQAMKKQNAITAKKKADCQRRLDRVEATYKAVMQRREEDKVRRKKKGEDYNRTIKEHIAQSIEVERLRKVETLRKNRSVAREAVRAEARKKKEKEEATAKEVQANWDRKVQCQLDKIEKQKLLTKQFTTYISIMAKKRSDELERRKAHLQAARERRFTSIYESFVGIREDGTQQELPTKEETRQSLIIAEAIKSALALDGITLTGAQIHAIRQTVDKLKEVGGYMTLAAARRAVERRGPLPDPLKTIIDDLLKDVINEYITRHTISWLINRMRELRAGMLERYIEAQPAMERETVVWKNLGRLKDLSAASMQTLNSEETLQIPGAIEVSSVMQHKENNKEKSISFGYVETEHMNLPPPDNLKSVVGRPPTPAPSMSEMANVVFHDPMPLIRGFAHAENCSMPLKKNIIASTERLLQKITELIMWRIDKEFPHITFSISFISALGKKFTTEEYKILTKVAKLVVTTILNVPLDCMRSRKLLPWVEELYSVVVAGFKFDSPFAIQAKKYSARPPKKIRFPPYKVHKSKIFSTYRRTDAPRRQFSPVRIPPDRPIHITPKAPSLEFKVKNLTPIEKELLSIRHMDMEELLCPTTERVVDQRRKPSASDVGDSS